MGFFDFMTEDIAIEPWYNTLIIHNDKVVIDSPSIVETESQVKSLLLVKKPT
jgi:actin-like ATPase involved in cell morphogenesis